MDDGDSGSGEKETRTREVGNDLVDDNAQREKEKKKITSCHIERVTLYGYFEYARWRV